MDISKTGAEISCRKIPLQMWPQKLSIKPRKTQSGVFLAEESSCNDVRSIFSIQVDKSMFNRRPEFPWIFFSMPFFINSPWVAFWRIFTCFSHAQKRFGIQITRRHYFGHFIWINSWTVQKYADCPPIYISHSKQCTTAPRAEATPEKRGKKKGVIHQKFLSDFVYQIEKRGSGFEVAVIVKWIAALGGAKYGSSQYGLSNTTLL